MKITLRIDTILILLISIFPILPQNYYIGSFNYPSICSILIVLIYFISNGASKIKKSTKGSFAFWAYYVFISTHMILISSFIRGVAYFFQTFLVFYVCFNYLYANTKRFICLIDTVILIGGIMAILGVYESISAKYLFQNDLLFFGASRYGILRAAVTFGQPICFGMYEAAIALLIFYRILCNDISKSKKRRMWVLYVLAVSSIFLSVSRLGICLFLSCQFIFIFKLGTRKAIRIVSIVCLGIVFMYFAFNLMGINFFLSLFLDLGKTIDSLLFGKSVASGTISYGNRLDLYYWVINDMRDSYLLGKGIDTKFSYKIADWLTKESIEVHYLYLLFHFGIFGLGLYLIHYISAVKSFFRFRSDKLSFEGKINFGVFLTTFLCMYFIALFGVQETEYTRIFMLLVILGLSYKVNRLKNEVRI